MAVKLWYDISRDDVRMVKYSDLPDGRRVKMPNVELRDFPRHYAIDPEAFTVIHEPVALLDELLRAGYRPTDASWSGGHVKALERHIEFVEKVATKLLERENLPMREQV